MSRSGLVTVLFTDLVESTALLSELGGEAGDELRRAHFRSLRRAISDHGGHEVKSTGDGLMVTFDRPSDGVACAVELQRETGRLARRYPGRTVAIRVGVAVGEATYEDGDWFGTPVVEAARLCAAASPAQILATDVVRALGGGRGQSFVARGPIPLKGLPDTPVAEVAWEPDVADAELPPLLVGMGGPLFVGRSLEADRLALAWKRSLEGRRQAVLVAGEPGVGKTRLARELATVAAQAGSTILYGRCDEELALAYQPFVEALGHLVRSCQDDILAAHVASWGGELRRIVPTLVDRWPGVGEPMQADPEVERYRLFEAVADLLRGAAEGVGVVLILDDLHWADKATLLLLRHLLRVAEPAPLLIVGTYRDTELTRSHPLAEVLADLRRHDNVERMALGGLDAAGVEAFVEAAAGRALDEAGLELARAVFEETEGNPFFVGQVLRHLAESSAIVENDGRWSFDGHVDRLGIPEGVREVVGRRLTRLPEVANVVLRTAAVIGREFELALVAEAAELSEDSVLDALEEAVAARLVVEMPTGADQFGFTHALVRESLYDELSTSRRVRLHRRVGAALERRAEPAVAVLAHHFCEAAVAGEIDKATAYALRAGEEALASLAYEDAARHFARGLEVLDSAGVGDTVSRVELLLGSAAANDSAGEIVAAQAAASSAADVARRLDDAELFARAALATVVGLPPTIDDVAEALLGEAAQRLDPADSAVQARVLAAVGHSPKLLSDSALRHSLTAEALAMARRVGDPATLAWALSMRHQAISGPATVEERLRLAEEMVGLRSEWSDIASVYRMVDLYELGDVAGARAARDDYAADADRLRSPGAQTWAAVWTTNFMLFTGEYAAAEPRIMQWFADHRGVPDVIATQAFGAQFFDLRRAQGRVDEVEPAVRQMVDMHPEVTAWRTGLALLLTDLQRRDELQELFDDLASDEFASMQDDPGLLVDAALLTEACAYLGDTDRARRLYDVLLPYAGRNIVVGAAFVAIGAASRSLGLLASTMEEWDLAEAHFADALDMNARMGARPWLARTQADSAEMLRRSGRAQVAGSGVEELLAQADRTAEEVGFLSLRRRIDALR